jgi:hypothetical protein
MFHEDTARWSCADICIQHLAPSGKQSRDNGLMNHGASRSAVSCDNNFSAAEDGAQCRCKTRNVHRIKSITDNAAQAGNA